MRLHFKNARVRNSTCTMLQKIKGKIKAGRFGLLFFDACNGKKSVILKSGVNV